MGAALFSVAQASAGDSLGCAVTTQSRLYCWGDNTWGQLGAGTTGSGGPLPATVFSSLPFSFVTAGGHHACALSGTRAYCWGQDALGQLGDDRQVNSTTPIPVVGVAAFSRISAGFQHTCGVAPDGSAYCWGDNRLGQLGSGSAGGFNTAPIRVTGGVGFSAISAGDSTHTCALTAAGAAYCWGANSFGQVGNGSIGGIIATPTAVAGGLTFAELSAGRDFTCGRTAGGAAYCWGKNDFGQLGNGQTSGAAATPVQVVSTPNIENPANPPSGSLTFTSVSAGRRHACALATDGNAYCWGSNVYGALGNELQAAVRGVPVRVGTPR
ncbi:MAG: hypothetical protein WKG32_08365 [Gemmatimonadaceae bacterium]